MLRQVKCEIISESRNSKLDAYILSESSMFVSKRRFILKTCGTTTTLTCIDNLLQLAKAFAGFDLIEDIFYSRKNFVRPELQLEPHHSFEREVALLDHMFADGAAYCMGTINGQGGPSYWHLLVFFRQICIFFDQFFAVNRQKKASLPNNHIRTCLDWPAGIAGTCTP